MSNVTLRNLSKTFRDTPAVRDINLEIPSGEFFSILGPSGCGKTTLLRMIAGFEQPTSGGIFVGGVEMTKIPPERRGIGMVFQNYALFPHMTVYENVAFGLETKNVAKAEIMRRVEKILDAVHLLHKIQTRVPQLSGGEQQRVAVARALVVEPSVLLMDEPLSNLDVALRVKTREEIRSLQRKFGITTVYVTHDQSEAMSLSDRIAVMRGGKVEQTGSPAEMYEMPVSSFVAEFLGGANVLEGKLDVSALRFESGSMMVKVPPGLVMNQQSGNVTLAIKPEAITLLPSATGGFEANIVHSEYLGFTTNFVVETNGITLRVTSMSSELTKQLHPGDKADIRIDWSKCIILR